MSSIDSLIDPIRRSPQFPVMLDILQRQWEEEKRKRLAFYEEVTPDQKAEFIDGEIIIHSPARNRHLLVSKLVSKLLGPYVQIHHLGLINIEKCLCVFPRNAYEPDVVFFGKEKAKGLTAETKLFPVPDLIVEVLSESTEKNDRGVKFNDYAASGVGEYWIMDADQNILEQYLLNSGEFELALKSSSGQITCKAIEGFKVEVVSFFDTEKNLEQLRKIPTS